jgi:hypothetical protein
LHVYWLCIIIRLLIVNIRILYNIYNIAVKPRAL